MLDSALGPGGNIKKTQTKGEREKLDDREKGREEEYRGKVEGEIVRESSRYRKDRMGLL